MTHAARVLYLIVFGVLLTTTGCLNLGPRQNQTRFYVLGGAWEEPPPPTPGALSVGLRDLNLAAYLQTPLMVVREGPHQVRFTEFHRWAEALPRGINRTVAGYLAARPAIGRVEVVPFRRGTQHDYVVQIRVLRFEGTLEAPAPPDAAEVQRQGAAHVLAAWDVFGPDGQVARRGTTDFRADGWTAGDYEGLVVLLDAGLDRLAADLAEAIAAL